MKADEERGKAEANATKALQQEGNAKQSEADALAVLGFFQEKVLAAARPKDQEGGLGVDASIRAAVDAAESQIGPAFEDRPLVEASIRHDDRE